MFSQSYNIDNTPMLCPSRPLAMDTRWKPHAEIAPNCPRCASSNTKFCYYNNYSFSQPRYFCKACRRYWTKGGSLRNVPVGGGCRKSRRAKRLQQNKSSNGVDSVQKESRSHQQTSKSAEIDLAAVFAKFLNQDSSVSSETSNSTNQQDSLQEGMMVQSQSTCDLLVESSELLNGYQEVSEVNTFELQSLLAEDVVEGQNVMWCDDAPVPSFVTAWQTQEFEEIPSDADHWKISANNVMNDNWDHIDLSGFEVFNRPLV